MEHAPVLFFGRNPAMMSIVDLQLKATGITAKGFIKLSELMAELEQGHAKMLVIGGGVEDAARAQLKTWCAANKVLVLEHSGGPQSLPDEIAGALT